MLHQSEVDITCSWRKIDEEIIEFPPVGILDELLDGIACHTSTPNNRLLRIDKETNRKHFYTILFNRFDEITPINRCGNRATTLGMEHLRNRRTMDIRIKESDFIALFCQSNGEVSRYSGFAYSTLARVNSNHLVGTQILY